MATEENINEPANNETSENVAAIELESPIHDTPPSTKRKRKELSLIDKVRLIHESRSSGKSQRGLAAIYKIGKTTVHEILKKKEEILRAYEENCDGYRKRICVRSVNDNVNRLAWLWYERMRYQKIQVSGPLLQERARKFATEFGLKDFRASNGWLENFRKRHNISFGGPFGPETVNVITEWTDRIPDLIEGYISSDIYNLEETGLYYRILPDKALLSSIDTREVSESASERLTITLCCNMDGEFEKPLVIGQLARPPCFRNLDTACLPVTWRANRRAWVTTTILTEWMRAFDLKLRKQEREVVLFLESSPSHPLDLKLTNIKLVFFPKLSNKTNSVAQPLHQGIIDAFRFRYRKKLLGSILAKLDDSNSPRKADEFSKEVSVLDACYWISSALKEVVGIKKCFEAAGFSGHIPGESLSGLSSYSMAFSASRESHTESFSRIHDTPLNSIRSSGEMKLLENPEIGFEQLMSSAAYRILLSEPMTVQEYASFDSDTRTSDDLSDGWEERLVQDFCDSKEAHKVKTTGDTPALQDKVATKEASNHRIVQSYPEALCLNKELISFALDENNAELITALRSVEEHMQRAHLQKLSSNANQPETDLEVTDQSRFLGNPHPSLLFHPKFNR